MALKIVISDMDDHVVATYDKGWYGDVAVIPAIVQILARVSGAQHAAFQKAMERYWMTACNVDEIPLEIQRRAIEKALDCEGVIEDPGRGKTDGH